ncbi:hypothetical protein MVEN_00256700 [Mycena venus]|uniref:Uncharacterized protein n=1 Tax=Mycena venus TaxID=2733690 RepID=A0A8H6Z2H9_9AGAR|nr:hypothetical protein MVEN_00256700 [Mycena venus]
MRFLFPSRARLKALRPTVKSLLSSRTSSILPDILWTSILALKESADTFPPLKSAVGGVIALYDIAERAKHSRSDALAIALRTKEIMDVVADAVPDASKISPSMLFSIERFTVLLEEIRGSMEAITLTSKVSRVIHLNRNERILQSIKVRLDDAYRDFLAASALRLEVGQEQLVMQQTQIYLDLKTVSTTTNGLALDLQRHARVAVLFRRPLSSII